MDNWTSVLPIRGLYGSLTRYAARPGERSRLSHLPNFGPASIFFFGNRPLSVPFQHASQGKVCLRNRRLVSRGASITFDDLAVHSIISGLGTHAMARIRKAKQLPTTSRTASSGISSTVMKGPCGRGRGRGREGGREGGAVPPSVKCWGMRTKPTPRRSVRGEFRHNYGNTLLMSV